MPFISHQTLLTLIRINESEVLQYDFTSDNLITWLWPAKASGVAVPPGELRRHRMTHRFTNPCCLCPLIQRTSKLVEAAVLILRDGPWSGECVALCARGRCGYIAFMDRIYKNSNLQLQYRPHRDHNEHPRPIYHHSEEAENGFRVEMAHKFDQCRCEVVTSHPTQGIEAVSNGTVNEIQYTGTGERGGIEVRTRFARVQPGCGVLPRPVKYRELLEKLDARLDPGVPEAKFNELFVKCKRCSNVTTRFAFPCHVCPDDAEEF